MKIIKTVETQDKKIRGETKLLCLACEESLGTIGGSYLASPSYLVCYNKDCSRYGLLTAFYKDWDKG